MNGLWQRYVAWFGALAQRERLIIALAVAGGILMLGMDQWVVPTFTETGKLARQASQDRDASQAMISQLNALELQASNPDAALQASLVQLKKRLAEQEPQIAELKKSLVAAADMPAFLENLLAGNHALQLQSLESLPPEPAIAANEGEAKAQAGNGAPKLYRHGVTLRMAGSYRDLMGYLAELEKSPQRVLWGDMKLDAVAYPKVELTLTVYTLSLDKAWMTL